MADRGPTAESGEDRLIARFFRPLAKHPGAFGLLDDAAAVAPPEGHDLVLTTDGIIGGVHVFADETPDVIARKALRVNLSDLAAKGATPLGFLLSLALPQEIGEAWLEKFATALGADADAFGCPLLGGDTDRTPGPLMISIAAFGTVPHGAMLRRSTARPGDRILVTGTIGDAALGLMLRRNPGPRWGIDRGGQDHLLGRYRTPQPRNAIAEALRRHASGGIDVSDGLAGDLAKMCRASKVVAEVEVARVPLSEAARATLAAEPGLIETVLTGGDDYEVLASVPESRVESLRVEAMAAGVAVTDIGGVRAASKVGQARFIGKDGADMMFARPSYSHF